MTECLFVFKSILLTDCMSSIRTFGLLSSLIKWLCINVIMLPALQCVNPNHCFVAYLDLVFVGVIVISVGFFGLVFKPFQHFLAPLIIFGKVAPVAFAEEI